MELHRGPLGRLGVGLFQQRDRAVHEALLQIQRCQRVHHRGVVLGEREGLLRGLDGSVEVGLLVEQQREVVAGRERLLVGLGRPPVGGDRIVGAARLLVHQSQDEEHLGIGRAHGQVGLAVGARAVEVAAGGVVAGARGKRLGVCGVELERAVGLAVCLLRPLRVAGQEEHGREGAVEAGVVRVVRQPRAGGGDRRLGVATQTEGERLLGGELRRAAEARARLVELLEGVGELALGAQHDRVDQVALELVGETLEYLHGHLLGVLRLAEVRETQREARPALDAPGRPLGGQLPGRRDALPVAAGLGQPEEAQGRRGVHGVAILGEAVAALGPVEVSLDLERVPEPEVGGRVVEGGQHLLQPGARASDVALGELETRPQVLAFGIVRRELIEKCQLGPRLVEHAGLDEGLDAAGCDRCADG